MTHTIAGALRTSPDFDSRADLINGLKLGTRYKVVASQQHSRLRDKEPMTGTVSVTGTNGEPVGVIISEGYVTRVIR